MYSGEKQHGASGSYQDPGMTGVVVAALISDEKFTDSHPAEEWAQLAEGVLVLTDEAGLVHYPSLDGIDVEKISDQ
jgi:hypothetical protein